MIASIVALLVLGFSFFVSGDLLVCLALSLISCGTLAIVPPEFIGGTTVLASSFAFLLLVLRQIMIKGQPPRLLNAAIDLRTLGLLTLFLIVAVMGAFLLPRIFNGHIVVVPMRGDGLISHLTPLQPTSSNFNQALNQIVDFGIVLSIYGMSRWSGFTGRIQKALLWGGAAVIITGLMDLVGTAAGLQSVLEQFRTASYVMMDDDAVAGVRRTIGLMSEASSYGGVSMAFGSVLFFTRYSFAPRTRTRFVYPISIGCLVFAVISTASTAYGALAVFSVLNAIDIGWRFIFGTKSQRVTLFFESLLSVGLILIGICVYIGWANGRQMLLDMLDALIFKKKLSGSYIERSSWTNAGLAAFWATHGIGVGVGSARTSNFFANILASTGVLGSLLFGAFVTRVFAAKVPSRDRAAFELAHGAKLSMIITFASLYFSGTTPDYGVFMALMMGLIVGLATRKGGAGKNRSTRPGSEIEVAEDEPVVKRRHRVARL